MTTLEKAKNIVVSGVELNWAKLARPVAPFGVMQYELQIASSDASKLAELAALGLKVKEENGVHSISLKRKAQKADGSDNGAPRVVDGQKQPLDGSKIGNGSKGNVIVYVYPYDVAGRKGNAASLSAVQVVDLVEYAGGGADFDIVESDIPASEEAGF